MKPPSQMSKTATLVEGALMMAMAYVLSMFPVYSFPWGGDVTFCATLPILMMGLRHGFKWGLGTAAAYSLLQLIQGLGSVAAVPAKTLFAMVLCALLDYLLAYTCLGFAGPIAGRFKNRTAGLAAAVGVTGLARLACSFLSGWVLWGEYAWEGWPVWLYSLAYNACWCVPDVALVLVATLLLSRVKALGLVPAPAKA